MYLSMINLRQTICVTHKIVNKLLTTCSFKESKSFIICICWR